MPQKRPSGLGKGLDHLIPKKIDTPEGTTKASAPKAPAKKEEYITLKVNDIEMNPNQPRKAFDEDTLLELSESIKQFGVITPIVVIQKKGHYEIVAGERRWRAAKLAGIKEIPVRVKTYTNQERVEVSLIENLQREDLNPIEEAMAFRRLLDEFKLKQDEVAERVSKSRAAVTNALRLLKLDAKIQQMIIDELISTGHARALLAVEDKEEQYTLANQIFDEKLSVREVEKIVKQLNKPKVAKQVEPVDERDMSSVYRNLEETLKNVIGTKVKISEKSKGKGKIEIEYYSEAELERIYDMILSVDRH
jgi:ParB family chromosome partitioning protein